MLVLVVIVPHQILPLAQKLVYIFGAIKGADTYATITAISAKNVAVSPGDVASVIRILSKKIANRILRNLFKTSRLVGVAGLLQDNWGGW